MFGDVGHGSLLACVALGMIIFEDRMLKQRSRMEVNVIQSLSSPLTHIRCVSKMATFLFLNNSVKN